MDAPKTDRHHIGEPLFGKRRDLFWQICREGGASKIYYYNRYKVTASVLSEPNICK